MFPLKASQQATGIIIVESNPKQFRIREYSMLDKDDQISGSELWGLSSCQLKKTVGGIGRTGKHSGQETTLDGRFCYLEIVQGWRGDALSVHPKDEIKIATPAAEIV